MNKFDPTKDNGSWLGHYDYSNDGDKVSVDVVEPRVRPLLYDSKGKPLTNKRPLGFRQ